MNDISTTRIVMQGILVVQIPVLIIIIACYGLSLIFNEGSSRGGLLLGAILGWFYWSFSAKKWVEWALNKGCEPGKLLKIGRYSLILWNRSQIDSELKKRNSI